MTRAERFSYRQNEVKNNHGARSTDELVFESVIKGAVGYFAKNPDELLEHLKKYPDLADYLKENM